LKKEDENDLDMEDCFNVAFNGNGKIAVVVGYNDQFAALEVGRNETNPSQLIFKKKKK
jgi:predicted nucleic acid-binding protein